MADIELVIKLSEQDYELACKYPEVLFGSYARSIKNGTPLPKGHGRLIYAKDVGEYLTLADVPTIIEADKAESEGEE